ncbi:N-acetyltransferase [Streptomyces sp. WMMC500]|uniref:N-acetyltransferase n=1 Tax=Streptomyces sp. WMMC500 TaxID=3015154 RepID=UPI00248ADD37|nr:N-acetyltransferase [Streptomyces sp. WMMC500]WBB58879.1 N-acetyltransferase [Streptomyces sp. WMMC500]
MEPIRVTSLAERPELRARLWDMADSWPEFMTHDHVANALHERIAEVFPEHVHVATDDSGAVVARAFAVPFALRGAGRDGALPGRGWDQVLVWAFHDRRYGVEPDTVSAIEIAVDAGQQGRGLSAVMLGAMRSAAADRGFTEVVAPVRPSAKHREPHTPMPEYAARTRADGLPYDPWLRVHVRAGGTLATPDPVAPASMVIGATLAEWRTWTGLPFDTQGWTDVPGALAPVRCEPDRNWAVYVEPNVWVRHTLR